MSTAAASKEPGVVVTNTLPKSFHCGAGDPVPVELIGATILRFGQSPNFAVEGGGLVIEYRPAKGNYVKRLVLAFTELGMWIHEAPVKVLRTAPTQDASQE